MATKEEAVIRFVSRVGVAPGNLATRVSDYQLGRIAQFDTQGGPFVSSGSATLLHQRFTPH